MSSEAVELFRRRRAKPGSNRPGLTLLLQAGVDPKQVKTKSGNSPLLMAAQNGYERCVEILMQARVDPKQVQPKDGNSPPCSWQRKGATSTEGRCSCRPGLTRRAAGARLLPGHPVVGMS